MLCTAKSGGSEMESWVAGGNDGKLGGGNDGKLGGEMMESWVGK